MSNELQNKGSTQLEVFSREIVELTCPPTTIEHKTDLNIGVPHEFNSLPMACYDKHIKENQEHIYYLNSQKTRYAKISPGFNNKINGEFEERLLFALLVIAYNQKNLLNRSQISNVIITTISEILKILGLKYHGRYKRQITQSLERLRKTNYELKECYYDAGEQQYTSTHMSIINSYKYVSQVDACKLDPEIASLFSDKRIKDLLFIKLDDSVISNFINKKGYLLYNADKLLSINTGIARKIYMYCDRSRWGNENDLICTAKINVLTQIIPIMSKNHSDVARIVENALKELKNANLIVDYKFYRESPIKNSWIELHFEASRKYNKSLYVESAQNFNQQFLVHSREIIDVTLKDDNTINDEQSDTTHGLNDEINNLFKDFILQNSTIKLINQLYEKHGIIHIQALIKDTIERADNYDSYIFKMLSSNVEPKWYAANQAKFITEENKKNQEIKTKQQAKFEYDNLVNEYNIFCNNVNNMQELKDKLKNIVNDKITHYTNNIAEPMLKFGDVDKYKNDITVKYQNYLADDCLFFAWLKFNNKPIDSVKNNKLFVNFCTDLFVSKN